MSASSSNSMKITAAKISAYKVPTDQPFESDGTAVWDATTVVLVELTAGGKTGLGYSYSSESAAHAAKDLISKAVLGADALAIPSVVYSLGLQARNMGKPGVVSNAISAVDIALWDLKARLFDKSLIDLLGSARDAIPAYGSGGFTSYTEKQLVDQLTGWASEGIGYVKMKIGREPDKDVSRAQAVVKALDGRAQLFVDANGAYTLKQALHHADIFGELGVTWFEEPVSSDDTRGLHLMVERAPSCMNIAAGEYIYVLDDARLLMQAGAVDVLQADVTRCGGVSGYMKISAACEMHHFPLSAHTSPSIHATLCCASLPSINVEYFHDHVRIERMFFDGAVQAKNGNLQPDRSSPGLGLTFKRSDAEHYKKVEIALP